MNHLEEVLSLLDLEGLRVMSLQMNSTPAGALESLSRLVNLDSLDVKSNVPAVTSRVLAVTLEKASKLRCLTLHDWSDINRSITNIIAKSKQIEQLTLQKCGLAKNPLSFILAGKKHGFKLELVHPIN